jgi:outer membrane cobalamin receptor
VQDTRRVIRLLVFFCCFSSIAGTALAQLRGAVVDPDGRPVAGARVLVSRGAPIVATAVTNTAGAFVFHNLPPGGYVVRVAAEGFSAEPVDVAVAARPVDPPLTIALRVAAISESIVVSAAQVDLPVSRVTDSVTVIGASELSAGQIEGVGEALRRVPGLTLTQSGGRGSLTSLFPRGGESDYTLVLVDGIPMNAFGGGAHVEHLPTANVERLEIVRGPQSALFGQGAIGAVVHVVTRRDGPPRAEFSAEGGGFGTTRLSAAAAGAIGAWSWGAGTERSASDGFTGRAPASGEAVSNDDYARRSLSVNVGWQGAGGRRVRGSARVGSDDRGFPGPFGANPAGFFGGVDRISRGHNETIATGVAVALPWSDRVRQQAQITYGRLDSEFESPFGPSSGDTRRLTARVQADARVSLALGVSAGAEIQRERAGSTFIVGPQGSPVPVRRLAAGYFGEARYAPPSVPMALTAGLRIEQIRRDALAEDPNPFGPRPFMPAETIVSVNPKLAARWLIGSAAQPSWTAVRAAAGTGIRAPDAFELAFTDNPGLRPERSRSVEIGLQQAIGGGRALVEATAFANRYNDLIVAVGRFVQSSRFRTDNISNARARGLEVSAAVRTPVRGARIDARITYTWLDTEILAVDRGAAAPPPFTAGDPLIRRPRHQGFAELAMSQGRMHGYLRAGIRGRTLDVEPSLGTFGGLFANPGYTAIAAGLTVRIARTFDAFGRIENLFDRRYEEVLGFPAPGRHAIVGVRLAAGR